MINVMNRELLNTRFHVNNNCRHSNRGTSHYSHGGANRHILMPGSARYTQFWGFSELIHTALHVDGADVKLVYHSLTSNFNITTPTQI